MKKLFTPLLALLFSGMVLMNVSAFGQDTLYNESFNYPIGELPTGWVLDADQPPPWSVTNTAYAGGETPELSLGYSFAAGTSRLISTPIDVTGYEELAFKYNQYMINYEMDWGEVIGLDITFDGGQNWEVLWEKAIGTLNIPQDYLEYYFNVPVGATEMQFAFRYEGNSNAINWWYIDDIIVVSVADNDLLSYNLEGSITPAVGAENIYTFEVLNGGKLTQTNYNVILYKEGIEVASVPGEPISFGEKIVYQLSWAPEMEDIGNSFIYGYVELENDEYPDNNSTNNLQIAVQKDDIASIELGNDEIPVSWLPYNFFNFYSMTQTLYYPEEIGINNAELTGILYTYQFDENVYNVQLQLWLGETDLNDLSEDWINPQTLTPVFDGSVTFYKGINQLFIPFDDNYAYKGQNLVVYSYKTYTEMVIGTPFFCSLDSSSMRSRLAESNDPFDPMNPTWGYNNDLYPNIDLLYSTSTISVNDPGKAVSISLYPNPANRNITVQADEIIHEVKMLNSLGQVVYQQSIGSNNHVINVSNLNPGFYFMQILTRKGYTTQKVQVYK